MGRAAAQAFGQFTNYLDSRGATLLARMAGLADHLAATAAGYREQDQANRRGLTGG